ncbi:MAG TPA: farnesyl diphosphate synthase [Steroidobacteraceae bacterium]|nr:farnesyl diphosphate synthase [Steroidobacteraceae bacterium]
MTSASSFAQRLAQWQARIEEQLTDRLPSASTSPQRLHEAMRYSVLNGGKRVRPVLMYATGQTLGIEASQLDPAACAIELIHAYSLVHDDLPAMDDDDLRRGRPTCHKAFDEATAILAGDALQVLAFQILAHDTHGPSDANVRLRMLDLLATASGTSGMAGGQALDLAAEGQTISLEEVEHMHACKTGALIRASVMLAAACKNNLSVSVQQLLERYAKAIGLAFQIQDDLLDIEGDPNLLGKATGADRAHAKPTYPAVAGIAAAKERVRSLHAQALTELTSLGDTAQPLREVSDWLVFRRQ